MRQGDVLRKQIQYYSYAITAVFFIFFAKILGNNGLAYLAAGIETMAICMIFLGDNISENLAKMLRYRRKRGKFHNAIAIKRRINIVQIISGLLLFLLLFFGADLLAENLFHMERAALIIRIMAPILLLHMISTVMLGYLLSFGVILPSVLMSVIRPVLFLVLGKFFTEKTMEYGNKVANLLKNEDFNGLYTAVGLAIAILVAELILFLALILFYFISDHNFDKKKTEGILRYTEKISITLRDFFYLNFSGGCIALFKIVLILVPFLLYTDNNMRGIYYGKYLVICSIPICFVIARFFLLYSRLQSAVKTHDNKLIREHIHTGMLYSWSVGIFLSVIMAVLASQLVNAIFVTDEILTLFLQKSSILPVVVIMYIYINMIHMAYGKKAVCIISFIGTATIYVFLHKLFLLKLGQNPEAFIWTAVLSLAIIGIILGVLALFQYSLRVDYLSVFVLPLICIGVTGLIVLLIAKYLTPHIGNALSCIIGISLGIVLFVTSLGFCRVIGEAEIEKLYGTLGKRLFSFLFK